MKRKRIHCSRSVSLSTGSTVFPLIHDSQLGIILRSITFVSTILLGLASAHGQGLIEQGLVINNTIGDGPYVALTFDACTGQVDERILQALIEHKIKSTIFVTARWLKRNPKAIAEFKAHPDLFEIENHGGNHLPAIDFPTNAFGLKAAGSPRAVRQEVESGAAAIRQAFGNEPIWFRGATGMYTASSKNQIADLHFKIAGYTLRGDGGAGFSKQKAATTIGNAKNGDVIIAHINQPRKPAGAGVVEGILRLKSAGFAFMKLQDTVEPQISSCNHCADSAH